ncbi:MAG: NINE protein [Desulfobulbaceae bacterium]|nr:MAG: NINE protein [Desulfobulbaceae bacterium]
MIGMVLCRACDREVHESAHSCPHCRALRAHGERGKNKIVAGLLALFLGGFGIHRFYLGQWWGVFYLLLAWTFIPSLLAFIEAIVFFLTNDTKWEQKYGAKTMMAS